MIKRAATQKKVVRTDFSIAIDGPETHILRIVSPALADHILGILVNTSPEPSENEPMEPSPKRESKDETTRRRRVATTERMTLKEALIAKKPTTYLGQVMLAALSIHERGRYFSGRTLRKNLLEAGVQKISPNFYREIRTAVQRGWFQARYPGSEEFFLSSAGLRDIENGTALISRKEFPKRYRSRSVRRRRRGRKG